MAKLHRFGDTCAISIGTGETVYMTVKETRTLSGALNKIARSIERENYLDSNGNTVEIELKGARP